MADATEAGIPAAGGQLAGESSRNAAIKRLKKTEGSGKSGPNTGATGLPKPGGGLVQMPGAIQQSSTPEKPKRV
jgi:hypothetical protein